LAEQSHPDGAAVPDSPNSDPKPIASFADAAAFDSWLAENHGSHPGIWMRIAKRGAPETSVTYAEALDVALRFGWIDGQKRALDRFYWLQSFTQRRSTSVWSKRNVEKATAMIEAGTMHPAGLAQVEAAKADGRWDRAYEGSPGASASPEFLAALEANPAAKSFYETLNAVNRYALYYRIHSAKKPETRAKRIETFIDMLARGEKFH
jgi:uncharacterized protein YdeI (YjbR/CyaY-like superfamily)